MPYIDPETRKKFDTWLMEAPGFEKLGEVNYVITRLLLDVIGSASYTAVNDVVGLLDCVKQEFYRRVAAPYEDEKIEENGDVY